MEYSDSFKGQDTTSNHESGHAMSKSGSIKQSLLHTEISPHPQPGLVYGPWDQLQFWSPTSTAVGRSLSTAAGEAVVHERNMSILGGCKLYPQALGWSLLLSCTIVMEAYDKVLITNFYAFPKFREAYGTPIPGTDPVKHQISPAWQAGINNGAVCGEIFGLLFNGYLTERFGYRKTMILTLTWMCLSIFFTFFATNLWLLLASQIICGVPWGIIQILAATYAAEVMPAALRAHVLGNVNMCWVIGQLVGTSIVRGMVSNATNWSFRIPFAVQWVWAVPLLVGVFFAPESPWWLIRHNRAADAKQALSRITSRSFLNIDKTIAMMIYTDKLEKQLSNNSASYVECFRKTNSRRTEISAAVWMTQALCGSTITGYAAYFYEQAGMDTVSSFSVSAGMYGVAIIGNIISWWLLRVCGRRTLYLTGLVASFLILVAGGIVAASKDGDPATPWILGSLMVMLALVYNMTIGPVCYVLVAEMPSTRLRVKTVALARVSYNVAVIINATLVTRMLHPEAWNWKGRSCFFFAGTTLLCLVWCYFRLPESKGLAYLELDILFEKRAPTKTFKKFQVGLSNSGYCSTLTMERSPGVWHGSQGYS